eukprot:4758029-Alexandrium_andersonii.AAC.1
MPFNVRVRELIETYATEKLGPPPWRCFECGRCPPPAAHPWPPLCRHLSSEPTPRFFRCAAPKKRGTTGRRGSSATGASSGAHEAPPHRR